MAEGDRIIFALDVGDKTSALKWIEQLSGRVGYFKVGLELYTALGPQIVHEIKHGGLRCFLDLKFHDIPNTVAGAVRSATRLGVDMMTVHISGGTAMLKAAMDAVGSEAQLLGIARPKIIGVSVLTSLDERALNQIGIMNTPAQQVEHLVSLATQCGIDGLVCSAADLGTIRDNIPDDVTVITPGIRPKWSTKDDQARITTPSMAVSSGADLLVIGRPISQADDPVEAVNKITAEIAGAA